MSKLKELRALFNKDGSWCKFQAARDKNFGPIPPKHPEACCWCIIGGIERVSDTHREGFAVRAALQRRLLARAEPGTYAFDLAGFNDRATTTHATILALINEAIAAEEAQC